MKERNYAENSIMQMFPSQYRAFWQRVSREQAHIQEIRLRAGRPIVIYMDGREAFLDEQGNFTDTWHNTYCVSARELEEVLEHICHYSPYAFEEELRRGFLTVAGGHRVGVAGQAVLETDGTVRTFKNISFLNIRVSHQIMGAADGVLPGMYKNGVLKNTLIISPPGCGKTTLLRDLIRQISNGNTYGQGMTVGVVDERSELAGSFLGRPQNDMGMRTDVLDGCPKKVGMLLLLRSMSPRVIAIDELGDEEELRVLGQASASGCKILATVHGEDRHDVERRFRLNAEFWESMFDLFLVLGRENGKCTVQKMEEGERIYAQDIRRMYDPRRMSGTGNLVPFSDEWKNQDTAQSEKYTGAPCR